MSSSFASAPLAWRPRPATPVPEGRAAPQRSYGPARADRLPSPAVSCGCHSLHVHPSVQPSRPLVASREGSTASSRGGARDMAVPLYQAKADLLRVLGHPARIRVLELLAEGELAAGELLAEIAIEAGSLSQQLAVLRRAGLVGQRRDAGTVVYSLTVPEIRHVLVAA